MGITGSDSSGSFTSATGTENESIKSQINMMGTIHTIRKKAASAFHRSLVEEDIDLDKQLDKERCFDDNEYEASTPSDKSRVNSMCEASLALERTTQEAENIVQEDLRDEKQSTLVNKSPGNDAVDSCVTSSESSGSSYGQCYDNSTSCDNSLTPCSTIFDSPSSQMSDLDSMNFLVSLVNLDGEDSKWISDTELDCFQSGFPSPSCKCSWDSEVLSCSSNASTPSEAKDEHSQYDVSSDHASLEAAESEDFDTDEPLFWPFECKPDWSSKETWRCFSMSPRKDTMKSGAPQGSSSKSIGPKYHGSKRYSKEGCRRRIVFGPGSTASKTWEWKQRNNINGNRKINSKPSRLKRSTKISMKIVPLEMDDDIPIEIEDAIKEAKYGKVSTPKLNCMDRDFWDDEFASKAELPIETLLGLSEFDAHEGVESEFNEDIFSLDDSL